MPTLRSCETIFLLPCHPEWSSAALTDTETEQDFMVLATMTSAWLLSMEKLHPKISLIREVRKCRSKGKQFNKTK